MSSYDDIQTATVIRYPYLWARQARKGETEGRKDRPVAVGVRLARRDGDLVLFFPITTQRPEQARFAAEIPAIEKRRAGLDADRRLWIILDEFNTDIVGRSFLHRARASDRAVQQSVLSSPSPRVHRAPQVAH